MPKTSRQQILEYLKTRPTTTAGDIQRALHMTGANARHHLAELEASGVVVVVGKQAPSGRGRPSLLYAVSERAGRHHLDGLSSGLLAALEHTLSAAQVDQILEQVAEKMAWRVDGEAKGNLSQRLSQAVAHLNGMGYQARWEARAGGPRLILGHCPYKAILTEHPVLCRLDLLLLNQLLGSSLSQTAKQEPTPAGLAQCVFMLKA